MLKAVDVTHTEWRFLHDRFSDSQAYRDWLLPALRLRRAISISPYQPSGTTGFKDLKRQAVEFDLGSLIAPTASLDDVIRSKGGRRPAQGAPGSPRTACSARRNEGQIETLTNPAGGPAETIRPQRLLLEREGEPGVGTGGGRGRAKPGVRAPGRGDARKKPGKAARLTARADRAWPTSASGGARAAPAGRSGRSCAA
jgi:hypothetical protein